MKGEDKTELLQDGLTIGSILCSQQFLLNNNTCSSMLLCAAFISAASPAAPIAQSVKSSCCSEPLPASPEATASPPSSCRELPLRLRIRSCEGTINILPTAIAPVGRIELVDKLSDSRGASAEA